MTLGKMKNCINGINKEKSEYLEANVNISLACFIDKYKANLFPRKKNNLMIASFM